MNIDDALLREAIAALDECATAMLSIGDPEFRFKSAWVSSQVALRKLRAVLKENTNAR